MIYLVRHGQTKANERGQYLGKKESPLNETGLKQHEEVLKDLSGIKLDCIFTSPRKRCTALADTLAAELGICSQLDERIAEIDFGIFELLTYIQAKERYPSEWTQWEKCDSTYVLPQGESIDAFEARVSVFAKELDSMGEKENVAVITHGGVITSLLCYLLKLDLTSKWRFMSANGSIIKIHKTNGYAYLEL